MAIEIDHEGHPDVGPGGRGIEAPPRPPLGRACVRGLALLGGSGRKPPQRPERRAEQDRVDGVRRSKTRHGDQHRAEQRPETRAMSRPWSSTRWPLAARRPRRARGMIAVRAGLLIAKPADCRATRAYSKSPSPHAARLGPPAPRWSRHNPIADSSATGATVVRIHQRAAVQA